MKKYIYYTLSLMLAACVVSCDSDDDTVANEELLVVPDQVTIGFANVDSQMTVLEDGGVANLEVVLSQALPYSGELVFEATSSDGSIETVGADDAVINEVVIPQSVVIPAGTTSVAVDFSFVNDNICDPSEIYTLRIRDFVMDAVDVNSYVVGGDVEATVNVVDELPRVVTVADGDVTFSLSFDASLDVDFGLFFTDQVFDLALLVDAGATFANPETLTWPAGSADGRYSVNMQEFGNSYPFDYDLTITFPDGSEQVYSCFITENSFELLIDRVTDGGNVTYTFTQI